MARIVDYESDLSLKIKDLYLQGKRIYEIKEAINNEMLDDGIRNRLKKMGIYKVRNARVKYDMDLLLNLHKTVEGWYLIGLLLADGSMNIVKTTDAGHALKKISLEIDKKDEDSLTKIRDYFVPDANLSYRTQRPLVSLAFNNSDFCDYLEQKGVSINKRAVTMPELDPILFTNRKFALAFLAGYTDGDGCISFNDRCVCRFDITCATPVHKELHKVFDFVGLEYTADNHDTYVQNRFSNPKKTLEILMEMYTVTDLVYRRRKERLRELLLKLKNKHPISYKNYGAYLETLDTTNYFFGGNK